MARKSFDQMNIFEKLIMFLMSLFFLSIGLMLLTMSIIGLKSVYLYENTPVKSIEEVKANDIVKLKLKPLKSDLDAPFSRFLCCFYKTEQVTYKKNYDGDAEANITKTDLSANELTLTSNGKDKIKIPFKNLEPSIFLKFKNIMVLNPADNKFYFTTTFKFNPGESVVNEYIIKDDEEVIIFGKVKDVILQPENNTKILLFEKITISEDFNPPINLFNNINTLLDNKLTIFVISTDNEKNIIKKLKQGSEDMITLIFSLFFSLVPVVMLLIILKKSFRKL